MVDYIDSFHVQDVQVLGPTVPYINKGEEIFLRTILVKYRKYDAIKEILREGEYLFSKNSGNTIQIDIDPYNF